MRRSRASITLAACLITLGPENAQAAPGHFALSWSAPPACPDGAGVLGRVERILNRAPNVGDGEVLIVRATVEQPERDQPWHVELETDNGRRLSTRSLEAASCDELASATALLVAILLEPQVEQTEPSAVPPVVRPRVPESTAPVPAALPERSAPVRFALGAFSGAVSGLLPKWSFGAGLDGSLAWKALRWNVSVAYWLPVEQSAPPSDAQGARFQLLSSAAELCLMHSVHWRLSGGICSGADLAFLHARGYGEGIRSSAEQANFVSLSAGARVAWAASSRLSLVFDADALLPLGSRRFIFEGSAPAQIHTPRAGAQLTFGVEFWLEKTETPGAGPTSPR